eukprot:31059-Pelagococcus_subviridis.AAC.3
MGGMGSDEIRCLNTLRNHHARARHSTKPLSSIQARVPRLRRPRLLRRPPPLRQRLLRGVHARHFVQIIRQDAVVAVHGFFVPRRRRRVLAHVLLQRVRDRALLPRPLLRSRVHERIRVRGSGGAARVFILDDPVHLRALSKRIVVLKLPLPFPHRLPVLRLAAAPLRPDDRGALGDGQRILRRPFGAAPFERAELGHLAVVADGVRVRERRPSDAPLRGGLHARARRAVKRIEVVRFRTGSHPRDGFAATALGGRRVDDRSKHLRARGFRAVHRRALVEAEPAAAAAAAALDRRPLPPRRRRSADGVVLPPDPRVRRDRISPHLRQVRALGESPSLPPPRLFVIVPRLPRHRFRLPPHALAVVHLRSSRVREPRGVPLERLHRRHGALPLRNDDRVRPVSGKIRALGALLPRPGEPVVDVVAV